MSFLFFNTLQLELLMKWKYLNWYLLKHNILLVSLIDSVMIEEHWKCLKMQLKCVISWTFLNHMKKSQKVKFSWIVGCRLLEKLIHGHFYIRLSAVYQNQLIAKAFWWGSGTKSLGNPYLKMIDFSQSLLVGLLYPSSWIDKICMFLWTQSTLLTYLWYIIKFGVL